MKLSIITINYNNHDGLRKTIESVVNQTYKDFQYIVIDGGSTDGSVDVIKKYAGRIDYWVSEPDRGIYHAMNKGIDKAVGEYCIFMNSGDIFYNYNVINDCISYLDGTSIITGNTSYPSGNLWYNVEDISLEFFFRGYSISHSSTFIEISLLKKYKYDEHYKICSDWKFWLQVLIKDDMSYKLIDNIISIFDVSGISSVQMTLRKHEHKLILKELFTERILKDYRGHLYGYENQLYDEIKHCKIHKMMYSINVVILKFLLLFRGKKSWATKFPLRLKD